jgi:hypothetical protein
MVMKNLKNIDFKQFFVQKGEKIGLWVCVGVMALLVVLMIKDVVAGPSASANAEKLTTLSKDRKQKIDSSQPDPNLAVLDPQIKKASSPEQVPQDLFALERRYFDPGATEDRKWRLPTVLPMDDSRVDYLLAKVPSMILFPKASGEGAPQVGVLVSRSNEEIRSKNKEDIEKRKKKNPAKARLLQQLQQLQQQMMMGGGGRGGMGGMGPMGPGGGPPGMGAMGMGSTAGGGGKFGGAMGMAGMGAERMQMFGQAAGALGGSQDYEIKPVPEDQIGNYELAEEIHPYRMVIISGAFPYKLELDQFRQALRFKTVEDMLRSQDVAGGAEFAGLSVQRREARPGESFDKKEWADLPLEANMKAILSLAIETDKSEQDKKLDSFHIIPEHNRTVFPRPKLDDKLKEAKYPEELPESIQETLTAMEKAHKGEAPKAPKQRSRFGKDFNFWGEDESSSAASESSGSNQPMGNKLENVEENTPDKILVRFYDTTVQPGMVYQYRVAVRMANPCFKKTDKAVSKNITQEKEIRGPWAELPHVVSIPEEQMFYVVDEKRSETGGYADKDKLTVQVHRWLEQVQTDPNNRNAFYKVGDWSVLEREQVRRGELIGEWKEIEVPVWYPNLKKYNFAVNNEERKRSPGAPRRQPRGIPVNFDTQTLLVDFEGGKRAYQVGANKITDESPIEALVLTPDGKLFVHNGKADTEDEERGKRIKEWKDTQQKVKEEADNTKGTGGTGFEGFLKKGKG